MSETATVPETPGDDLFAQFKAAAEHYMRVIERAGEFELDPFLAEVAPALGHLIAAALRLPHVWDDAWEFTGERRLSLKQLLKQHAALQELIDEIDDYVTVTAFGRDVPKRDKDAVLFGHLLIDDLTSIYQDIEEGMHLLSSGSTPGEAIYRWHWGFWNHWGEHAVDALRIIVAQLALNRGGTGIGSE